MSPVKIVCIQVVNLVFLVLFSVMAGQVWWKFCSFGMLVMLVLSVLAARYKESAVALTVGSLPIAWMLGLLVVVVGNMAGLKIG